MSPRLQTDPLNPFIIAKSRTLETQLFKMALLKLEKFSRIKNMKKVWGKSFKGNTIDSPKNLPHISLILSVRANSLAPKTTRRDK